MFENDLPLTEPTLNILLSLARAPAHGYAIMQTVEELSGGRVVLSTGTLYGAVKRLLKSGWITPVDEPDAPRNRKSYALTDLGRRLLRAETERLERLSALARGRLA